MRDAKGGDSVPASTLLDDRADIWQRVAVVEVGQAVRADDCVQLGPSFFLHLGERCQHEEECLDERERLPKRSELVYSMW